MTILTSAMTNLSDGRLSFISVWAVVIDASIYPVWNKSLELKDEVKEWLDANVHQHGWDYNDTYEIIGFDRESDALYFHFRFHEGK